MFTHLRRQPLPWHSSHRLNSLFLRHLSSVEDRTKDALRALLRETAQPVAVVTSLYPLDGSDSDASTNGSSSSSQAQPHFHGATLSSFASIALDPHPLVSFSLRIPSRMATSLKSSMQKYKPSLVVNILSSTQADTAVRFSRADLYPHPFRITPYELTEEGLPVLCGSLGALSCSLISCLPLHNLYDHDDEIENGKGTISELFIARVVRVETEGTQMLDTSALPLLYHHRQYATTQLLDTRNSSKNNQ